MNLRKKFRITAYLEGLSFLVLLGIAMPLKYVYGNPFPVRVVGWIHGLLFITYVVLLSSLSAQLHWSLKKKALGFLAGLTPFGTFLFDYFQDRNNK